MKKILQLCLILLFLTGIYWFFAKMQWLPSLSSFFTPSPVLIAETPLLITGIKQMATLMTVEASDEVVISKIRQVKPGSPKKIAEWLSPVPIIQAERLVLIVKGKVFAGTDLNKLDSSAVFINGDSVSLTIPSARIQDIQVNPSGTEVFIEEGAWSQEETSQLMLDAKEKLRQRALEKQVPAKADEQALLILRNFLHLQGFKKIRVATLDN
ncbi:DUF4230 domain-containing protein [Flavihumibacter sp. CACIAM 22H1]|uniref:DUF4230 domain-containing protein n=1 Tax=Flavihumibacter sp. CACIAM 22H1 TaxID=1812911 RepID=UPI0007A89BF7|nr:DUF4230 domain-containing protein [Flavihumibacter sp. CACIAM 22H1]KYP12987.1 MAG: hypothetical protein A1D16_03675 [Flavihumibacter sp. CACIAM 22H1]